ncbi:hypothetical protein B566_EDAN017000 [Ephemera danica]|nr:hypothetical protein B566_EDAN017000 [Ephemera danica]
MKNPGIAWLEMQAYEKCHAIIKEYRTDIDRAYLLDVENLNVKHVELQSNAIKMFDEWNCMKEAGIVLKQRHDFIKTVLCNTKVDWVKMNRNQQLPSNALPGGKTKGGEILYFGRTTHTGGQGYLGYGGSI